MTPSGILWFLGLILIFIGEQIAGIGTVRWVFDGIGAAVVIAAFVLRARGLSADDPSVRDGVVKSLIVTAIGTSALVVHALGTDEVTALLGFTAESRQRWQGVLGVLTPVLLVLGAVPMTFLDLVLSANPVVLPRDASRRALTSGLYAALAVTLVFPFNYLVTTFSPEPVDTAFFRTSRAGPATRAAAAGLTEPVTVHAFFPPGNDVLVALQPYLSAVDAAGGDQLSVETHDQAVSTALAEELKLTSNGWIVIRRGEDRPAKFKMRLEKDRATRDLKRFDELFLKNLLKATRGERQAYFLRGHGEASHRERDDPWRKIADLRKSLEEQSYDVDDLGLVDGLADAVPADADLLVIAAPTRPLIEAEVASITRWLQNDGGSLLVLVDARTDPLDALLGNLGLDRGDAPLADVKRRVRGYPPQLVLTDRYGTHPSVTALARKRLPVPWVMAAALTERDGFDGKRTPLMRSYGTTFEDADRNGQQGEGEPSKVHNLAYAVEAGSGDQRWRAVVMSNIQNVSDQAGDRGWKADELALDAVRWLGGEADQVGGAESEEDVKIDVTSGMAVWWFWGTLFLVPLIVLGGGITWTTVRRRQQ